MERIAVIADIHGNRWALERVLEDIARRAVDAVVNLGDSLYGPLDPGGTADVLLPLGLPTVRGNEDRIVCEPHGGTPNPTLAYVRESLRPRHVEWLESLPVIASLSDDVLMCHGCLEQDDVYMMETVDRDGQRDRDAEALDALLAQHPHAVVLCAHSHVPRVAALPGGKLVVNPGSVGLQAYTDDIPHAHAMMTGSPHARYSILTKRDDDWSVEPVKVRYDWESAAAAAVRNGRPDWASWLRTGRADATNPSG